MTGEYFDKKNMLQDRAFLEIDCCELYGDNLIDELNRCKTVEEVESLRCNECSENGHWGWCDGWIRCPWKERIKEILGRK